MVIGNVRASGGLQTQLVSDRSSELVTQATVGLGDAVNRLAQAGMGFLNSQTDIERIYDNRAMASKSLELDTQFLEYQQARAMEFTEYSRGRSASPNGMTREYDTMLAEREREFLANVPERHREEMSAKLQRDRAQRVGSAFAAELDLLDTADTNTLNKGLNTLGSGLKGGGVSLEDAEAQWIEMVEKSALPPLTKQEFIDSGKVTLQGLEFGTIVEQTALGYGAVGDGSTGDDVVAAGLLPQDRGVLNAIAQNESPAYNIWNGGSTFEGYEDHPAATSKAPGESTAAGRYQFILGTWRAATASYQQKFGVAVPDFSPEWQDRVALHWAEVQFNRHHTGKTFREILAGGNPQELLTIRDVLGKPRSANPNDLEWQGLGHMSDAQFIEVMTGQKGFAGGGTGAATGPNVWTDPRFADLPLDQKQGFANAAAAAAEQQKAAMASTIQLERDRFMDEVYNAGYSGDPAIVEALKSSRYWDAEAQAKFNAGQEVFRKAEADSADVGAKLASGTMLGSGDAKALGRWFGEDNFAGIAQGNQDSYDLLKWAVNQGKLFPDGSVDAFRAAIGNAETQQNALAFLAAAHKGDSSMLRRSGFSQDDIAQVQLFQNLAERKGSLDAALDDYRLATDRQTMTGKSQDQLASEATKLFQKSYPSASEIVEQFDGWFSRTPDTKLNPTTESQLMLDASTAFQDGYAIYGTEEAATAYMESYLDKIWGVSQSRVPQTGWGPGLFTSQGTTKGVLTRHPPEKYYVGSEGDLGFLYQGVSDFAAAGGASPWGAVLVPDETTDREVREGKLPTYKVLGMDEYGAAIVLEGRFGGPDLQAGQDAAMTDDAMRRNAVEPIARLQQPLIDLEGKITYAETFGAKPEELEGLRREKARLEQQMAAETLAAVENGYLSPDMIVDSEAMGQAVADTLMNDPALPQRLETLALTHRDLPMEEARQLALATIIEKDFKVTPQVALSLVERFMEQINE